jgi:hypothetical protein
MSGPDFGSDPGNAPAATPPPPRPATPAGAAASEAANAAMTAMEGMFRSFSAGEQFMVAGAILFLAADFLLGSLFGNGQASAIETVGAAEVLLAIWLKNRRSIAWPIAYEVILSVLVVGAVAIEFSNLLVWVNELTRAGYAFPPIFNFLTAVCYWVGAGLMGWGVLVYWRGRAS